MPKDVNYSWGSILNNIKFEGLIWSFKKREKINFDNEQVIHTSSKNNEENGYDLERVRFPNHLVCCEAWGAFYIVHAYVEHNYASYTKYDI